jgi:hypothetical protein
MTEKRQTSQGYIIRILQHFATKLRNITNFVMHHALSTVAKPDVLLVLLSMTYKISDNEVFTHIIFKRKHFYPA